MQLAKSDKTHPVQQRLLFLDGLRGLAIALVVCYHAYSARWKEVLPYSDQYDSLLIFRFGNYGVQLFFLISGFVIAMSLKRCDRFSEFIYKRWLRLFPAMLVGSIFVFAIAPLFSARPYGQPALLDMVSGLTLIEPEFYRYLFGYNQRILEGGFWTLFVEVKFYLVSGLLYFYVGRRRMIIILTCMFFSSIVLEFSGALLSSSSWEGAKQIYKHLDYQHYGWFVSGMLFYEYSITKKIRYWLFALAISLVSARCLGGLLSESMIVATILVLVFAFSQFSSPLRALLGGKVLVFLGFISYPLYLIHEQTMISAIIQLAPKWEWAPVYFIPVVPMVALVGVAWIIAKYLEPFARLHINRLVMNLAGRFGFV